MTPADIVFALKARSEIAFIDLRDEADHATGHPLFASQIALAGIEAKIADCVPRRDCRIALLDNGGGLASAAKERLAALGYPNVSILSGGLNGWREAGLELFADVNSYSKAFGELVEVRRHTPSLAPEDVDALIAGGADIAIMDARRLEEHVTMTLPESISVPGAELVLRAPAIASDPQTTIIVHCAGRTRSIIGAQSLINAGLPNPVHALRNGTIGWTLAGKGLIQGQSPRAREVDGDAAHAAAVRARLVSYRAGVRRLAPLELDALARDPYRTLYRFDVRSPEEYRAGHIPGFRSAPGGQLVQETDMFAPVRGARIVLADDLAARAHMTASWLAQMGWEVYVLEGGFSRALETGAMPVARRLPERRYKRPYEGTDNPREAMQAYLDWEAGLVEQLERDATHGFFVI